MTWWPRLDGLTNFLGWGPAHIVGNPNAWTMADGENNVPQESEVPRYLGTVFWDPEMAVWDNKAESLGLDSSCSWRFGRFTLHIFVEGRISSWPGMLTQACMYGNMDMLKAGPGLCFPWFSQQIQVSIDFCRTPLLIFVVNVSKSAWHSLTPPKPISWVQACNEQELNAQTFNGETWGTWMKEYLATDLLTQDIVQGLVNVLFWVFLNITFKYLLEIISQ